jgi:hypothetical protein
MLRIVNQSRIKATRNAPRYKFGYPIPHNYNEAMQFDLKNGNTLWQEATDLEMSQLAEYDTFRDLGHKDTASPPTGYKKICTHLIYGCKHDSRHKAQMVADSHLTDIPLESVYSVVVSLRGLRIVTFLAKLNGLDLWATDIGNAYLEAFTMEQNYIIAGPEFGQLEGHYLIIVKALYGLCTSGLHWRERFADCLRNEGFSPCKAEPDIWMRLNGDLYEYVQFQSLIGAMQWAVSIGRLDSATAVMSLSSFRAMPRRGHLERAKQIYGYLQKMKEAMI